MNDQQERILRYAQKKIHSIDDTLTLRCIFTEDTPVYLVSRGSDHYVLRMPTKKYSKSIEQEIHALDKLIEVKKTPNIIQIYGTNEPTALLKTFIQGRKKRFPQDRRLYHDAYDLLNEIYDCGVVRVDVKLSNMAFNREGAHFFDFDFSQLAENQTELEVEGIKERDFIRLRKLFFRNNNEAYMREMMHEKLRKYQARKK